MGNCYISRRNSAILDTKTITESGTYNSATDGLDGYSSVVVNVSGGNGIGTLPSAYDQIEYVTFGTGSYGYSGFTLRNYFQTKNTIIEAITTTPDLSNEQAFFGDGSAFEAYYSGGTLHGYSGLTYISNTETQIEDGTVTKNETQFSFSSSGANSPYIGYYSIGRYTYQGRMYSFKILRLNEDTSGATTGDETTLIELVPCIRKSDNIVGLFDLVYQVFYVSEYDPFVAPS